MAQEKGWSIITVWIYKRNRIKVYSEDTANVAENDNINKIGRDDVTRPPAGSSIETRGIKK